MQAEGNVAAKVAAAIQSSSKFLHEKVAQQERQLVEKENNIRPTLIALQKLSE